MAVEDTKHNFSNHRDWRGFIVALQATMAYPKVIAVRTGRRWLATAQTPSPSWLVGNEDTPSPVGS